MPLALVEAIGDFVRERQNISTPMMLLVRVLERRLIVRGKVGKHWTEHDYRAYQPECVRMLLARRWMVRLMMMSVIGVVVGGHSAHLPRTRTTPE